MLKKIDVSGEWRFCLDEEKIGIDNKFFVNPEFNDTIILPSTTSLSKKGKINLERETGFLTDEYKFEGFAWYSKKIVIDEFENKTLKLFLERTRLTTVWIDGVKIGEYDSLCTPHCYDITNFIKSKEFVLTILVNNTDYPTRGGHMTSADTQSNWNGITGEMSIRIYEKTHISDIKAYPNVKNKTVKLRITLDSVANAECIVSDLNDTGIKIQEFSLNNKVSDIVVQLGENPKLWSEYNPVTYSLKVGLKNSEDFETVTFGLREFSANEHNFLINGTPTVLRGKHDGLIFPLTGYAPTTVDEWYRIMSISKSYGINHYRFHTCCPPESAFIAADMLGIYMSPEILFWGTLTSPDDENHNAIEQEYLVEEGRRILDTFGNHPSFAMFSLGNELWGSSEQMGKILKEFHERDQRHLYTQGCNNFQFWPQIIPEDDFFVGVRLSKDRLIRGSYATCDAPLGHIQTNMPSTNHSYDEFIIPTVASSSELNTADEIEIQYGTGVKKVKVSDTSTGLIPNKPVVTHEIGQFAVYPNFKEIEKYTGTLKARNFEIFRERLEEKGMLDLADDFFNASGKLSVACYKEELECALRSKYVAGFQILDIQDFSGQGTALVGILDAFMDNKGHITPEQWRGFCSDAVILAQFEKYVYKSEEEFNALISLSYFRPEKLINNKISCSIYDGDEIILSEELLIPDKSFMLNEIGKIKFKMPKYNEVKKLLLTLNIDGTDIKNSYELWVYPKSGVRFVDGKAIKGDRTLYMTGSKQDAIELLNKGERVLYLPNAVENSIKGFYCTDFWCYPMFRSISESMGKEVPIGTMGLIINNSHNALKYFKSENYSTPQWYTIVSNSDLTILDNTDNSFRPIVQMIDNFERNHKLGLLYEAKIGEGSLIVCTSRLNDIIDNIEVKTFAESIINYGLSDDFKPEYKCEFDLIMGGV